MPTRPTLLGVVALLCSACSPRSDAPEPPPPTAAPPPYTPTAVFCVHPSINTLCSMIPCLIGPDPMSSDVDGYQSRSNNVTTAAGDAQSPFDNRSWQMFLALNWQANQPGD